MSNTEKQLAELLAGEKKLLEQQKKEQGALKQNSVSSRNSSGRKSAN